MLTPGEGHVDPYSLTQALAQGARAHGANIQQHMEVAGLGPRYDGGWHVITTKGMLKM